jgi:hypothetical protein
VLPFIAQYGTAMCARAIAGVAYDPWVTTEKNGTEKRHDEWERIFGDDRKAQGRFERFCNQAPRGWACPPELDEGAA